MNQIQKKQQKKLNQEKRNLKKQKEDLKKYNLVILKGIKPLKNNN